MNFEEEGALCFAPFS